MNQDKAREFFSAYYDGTLEAGLRQAFESRLLADAELHADYAAFAATMDSLGGLDEEEIEIPLFLSDRVATRIEAERAQRARRVPAWTTWLRGLAFAGLGAVAIVGAVLSINNRSHLGEASVIGVGPVESVRFVSKSNDLLLEYRPSSPHTVVVASGVNGKEIERYTADSATAPRPLQNPNADAALLSVSVVGEKEGALIALPGSAHAASAAGEGTIRDFACAVAARYHTPVILQASTTEHHLTWKLEGSDPVQAAAKAIEAHGYSVDQRSNGIVTIQDR